MLPFLQDTLRADGLALTIGGLTVTAPLTAAEILLRLGPVPIADWTLHFAAMVLGSLIGSEQAPRHISPISPHISPYLIITSEQVWEMHARASTTLPIPRRRRTPAPLPPRVSQARSELWCQP